MKYTLVADGGSDAILIPIINWSFRQYEVTPIEQWADLGRIPRQRNMDDRLKAVLDLYPCDVLFVHRDAEGQSPDVRRAEIAESLLSTSVPHIPVVPVRMTEAWLLADESAIRSAAGNPNGTENLNLPDVRRLEDLPDPKNVLFGALTTASGLNSRRRSRLPVRRRVHLITNYIDDYSSLKVLPGFQALQQDIRTLIETR